LINNLGSSGSKVELKSNGTRARPASIAMGQNKKIARVHGIRPVMSDRTLGRRSCGKCNAGRSCEQQRFRRSSRVPTVERRERLVRPRAFVSCRFVENSRRGGYCSLKGLPFHIGSFLRALPAIPRPFIGLPFGLHLESIDDKKRRVDLPLTVVRQMPHRSLFSLDALPVLRAIRRFLGCARAPTAG